MVQLYARARARARSVTAVGSEGCARTHHMRPDVAARCRQPPAPGAPSESKHRHTTRRSPHVTSIPDTAGE